MSSPSGKASITIKPKDFFSNWTIFQSVDYELVTNNFLETIAVQIQKLMKENAPKHTGNLARSIQVKTMTKATGGLDLRANIVIGPTVPYASYPESGVKPSPGRYVPAIHVRIHTGTHPGQKAQWYVKRTYDLMNSQLTAGVQINLGAQLKAQFEKRMAS